MTFLPPSHKAFLCLLGNEFPFPRKTCRKSGLDPFDKKVSDPAPGSESVLLFFSRNLFQIHFREIHIQFIIFLFFRETAFCLRVAIHVWKVGLDIVDWRHIQKIRTFHDQHRTFFFPEFHPNKLYGRKSDRIRAKWRTGGKNSHPSVTTKPRWTYRRAPGIPDRFRKFPDQPQIIIRLDFPQCIRILIFRQKMDFCRVSARLLCRGIPNFSTKSDLIYAICFICIVLFLHQQTSSQKQLPELQKRSEVPFQQTFPHRHFR